MASAQEVGNPARGLVYAKANCAQCHAVEPGPTASPVRKAWRFEDIANVPGMTAMALTVWLHTSHKTMPDFIIPQDDEDNVIAYFRSLKRPPETKAAEE
jgi:mono/diheme cytochrome c family protein